jgi:Rrf2 family protein
VGTLIRTTEAATLALHAAAMLAGAGGIRLSSSHIAQRLRASEAHVAKVLQRLSSAGLVRGKRGPGGGFVLAKPAADVTLREIYETIEGPLSIETCMLGKPVCDGTDCPLGELFDRLSTDVMRTLEGMTLESIELDPGGLEGTGSGVIPTGTSPR